MATPTFILVPDRDQALATANLKGVRRENNVVFYDHNDGGPPTKVAYDTEAEARTAYADVLVDLDVTTPATGISIVSISPVAMEEGTDPTITVRGTGFSATATITLTFYGAGTYAGTATYVSDTEITILASGLVLGPGVTLVDLNLSPAGTTSEYRIRYTDADGGDSGDFPLGGYGNSCFAVFATA